MFGLLFRILGPGKEHSYQESATYGLGKIARQLNIIDSERQHFWKVTSACVVARRRRTIVRRLGHPARAWEQVRKLRLFVYRVGYY